MRILASFLLLIALALPLGGCAGSVSSSVNAYAADVPPGAVHAIAPTKEQQGDLAFGEVSQQALRALGLAGLRVRDSDAKPDIVVYLDYGVSDPQMVTTYDSTPVYGYRGFYGPYGAGNYGVVGYDTTPVTQAYFHARLTLTAYDFHDFHSRETGRQIWKVEVGTTGGSSDLRSLLPVMLDAAMPYMGNSTGVQVAAEVPLDDPQLAYIRTGAWPPPK